MLGMHSMLLMQLRQGKKVKIIADGNCMCPIINDMDVVEVLSSDKYRIGDIVLVSVQDRLCIHRIVKMDYRGYITKGDHSYMPDKRVKNHILGKAIVNNTQKRSLCTNNLRPFLRAKLSMCNGKVYRQHIKKRNYFARGILLILHKLGDLALYYII